MFTKFGTCSWKYDSWRGIIYSNEPGINYLQEYSKFYSTVEIDQWFWSLFDNTVVLPAKNDIEAYKKSVPKDFLFTIKVPNALTLTHYYRKDKSKPLKRNPYFLSNDLFADFVNIIKPLHEHLGSLIFQFEYLNKEKMPSLNVFELQFGRFYEKFASEALPIALEIRNPNFLNSSFFSFLKNLHITPVLLEGYFMPSIVETYSKFKELISGSIIIRLHGPDRSGIEKISGENWNQIYIDRTRELLKIRDMIVEMQNRDINIYININNHFEGSAPLTIARLQQFINQDLGEVG